MENKYLISVDLDDTLLTSDKIISGYTINEVQNLIKNNHHFILNTGRPHQGALKFLKALNIHEPIIVNNGGAIITYDNDYEKIISIKTFHMNLELVRDFHKKVKHMLKNASITSVFDFYAYDIDSLPFWVVHKSPLINFHSGDIIKNLNTLPIMSEYYVKKEHEEEFEQILNSKEFSEFKYIKWGWFDDIVSYEISSKNASKGNAMLYLCDLYNIQHKNTFGFGDQLNDLSLLEKANYGVAMINGVEEIKKNAKYISDFDNNNDGVIKFINKIIKE